MISLFSLQEFMSLTSIHGKLCASVPCSLFYVDSIHATWILHQVPPRLLRSPICIELMVALKPIISWVSPSLSLICTSTLIVPLYDIVIVALSLDLAMHPPMHYFIQDHTATPHYSLGPLSFVEILS
ncbi:hypothetical protein BHM03_00042434 [Ensete ventricosum]|nr:hypothetical protein BHM03_00042434 [Ensete ventricosum]